MNKKSIVASLFLYWICFFFLLPHFLHQVDPDGIAYLNQAKLYFKADFKTAINGCWSPLFPLILSPFIKFGIDPLIMCRILNGIFSCLILFSVNGLVQKMRVSYPFYLKLLPFVICIITLSMTFYLLGPDILQTLLLSVLLNIVLRENFFSRNRNIMLAAFIGAVAYLAKAYNFSLIILFAGILFTLHYLWTTKRLFSAALFKKLGFFYLFFLLFSAPYIIIISIKYQRVTFSTAGAITMHKSLEPGDFFSVDALPFVPPPSAYSLASSDDPSLIVPHTVNMLTSKHYFFKEIKIFFATIIEYTKILNSVSVISITILLLFLFYLYKEKMGFDFKARLFVFTLLYPLGYFLIAIEWRYVWINIFTILLMLSLLLDHLYHQKLMPKKIVHIISFLALLSFCISPILNLRKNPSGEAAYQMSVDLKKNGLTGNFVYDPNHKFDYYFVSYFNNSKCFGIYNTAFTNQDIISNKDRYSIKYIFCYYRDDTEKKQILLSALNEISSKVYDTQIRNLVVFELK